MSDDSSVFSRLRARGGELFSQVSKELMNNPQFIKAMQAAMWGREKLDEAVAEALKAMNVPSGTEFKRALERIDALERQVAVRNRKKAARATAVSKLAASSAAAAKRRAAGRS